MQAILRTRLNTLLLIQDIIMEKLRKGLRNYDKTPAKSQGERKSTDFRLDSELLML
jgi:hypothetical protein